jgi:ubiquinone/menaquinone biosynthesis C-methylase UbiE
MDRTKTAAYYEWQKRNGCLAQYGERTDWDTTERLLCAVLPAAAHILDLGCGTGSVAQQLVERGVTWSRYVGIDLSQQLIEEFQHRGLPKTEPLVGDATVLERLPKASFDIVLCLFLLQDLPRDEVQASLHSIHDVLKPEGFLLLALTLDPASSKDLGSNYKARALEERGIPGKETYLWSKPDLQSVIQRCGFLIHEQEEKKAANGLLDSYTLWRLNMAPNS